ncbi:GDSL-type esterase/lipase family protein [Arthrobacter burdickii]|uniref:GDSL-type esterase/lipase family protein n=1 Tax=Arthrobacter burdickii TaxID=3035920 RepID=A0ABT8JWT2_9MICC|nr:GDSL-type esterase/lipase family protein [Arthrobacter burdickii]MDN4609322.1 GDSL-type esterase/lipase family protein [Arthrobacter burdickii]
MFEIKWRRTVAATALVLSLTAGAGLALPAQAVAVPAATSVPALRVAGYNVDGVTYTKWNANRATLGNPISSKSCDAVSCSQRFQRGSIIWTQRTGAQMVLSYAIGARYSANGWTKGPLGFPLSDEFRLDVRGGAVQKFQNGSVYWSSATGAHAAMGAIKGYFAANTYERGFLGYPRSEEVAVTNGVRQDFEGGKAYWSSSSGRVFVTTGGYIQTYYENKGGAQSSLGLPTSNKTAWQGGYYQRFQGGVITWGPTTGARSIDAGHFTTLAGSFGKYGWPTRDTWKDTTGTHTQFQTGIITTGAPPVTPPPVTAPLIPAPLVTEPSADAPGTSVYPFTSVEATATSVVLYGDSQLDGDSWSEQGARALGFTDQASHLAFGGMGYSTSSPWAGGTGWTALQQGLVPFPGGTPGLVLVSLGGNDATTWKSDAQVIADSSALWAKLKLMYPQSRIVINGVMSRSDSSHVQRRHIDDVLAANAAKDGVTFISVAGLASTADAQYLDNVHLAQAGHDAVAALYIPKLAAALGQ